MPCHVCGCVASPIHGGGCVASADGRSLGTAFVLFASASDLQRALAKNRQELGGRWLEVYEASRSEVARALGDPGLGRDDTAIGGVVLLTGLPFRVGPADITAFLRGFPVSGNAVYVARLPLCCGVGVVGVVVGGSVATFKAQTFVVHCTGPVLCGCGCGCGCGMRASTCLIGVDR